MKANKADPLSQDDLLNRLTAKGTECVFRFVPSTQDMVIPNFRTSYNCCFEVPRGFVGYCWKCYKQILTDIYTEREQSPEFLEYSEGPIEAAAKPGLNPSQILLDPLPLLLPPLNNLTQQQQDVLLMSLGLHQEYGGELSDNEIASLLNISPGNVRSTKSRAKTQLSADPELATLFAKISRRQTTDG
ncbi:RNA polymerase sigma factor [Gemmata obscuriglobus]|uniref:RNA polymerase sigma factor n=1 Tax=Gemmata obscuriglobus TaxID=114 RepID=UPI0011CE18B1|nr:sigma factor-like helix-turn-helix DNA-binding protein [Gemmata obscuriglobus]